MVDSARELSSHWCEWLNYRSVDRLFEKRSAERILRAAVERLIRSLLAV
jgi:hypothetical protein